MNIVNIQGETRIATARWTDPDEAAALFPYRPGSFWLGRSPVDETQALGFDDDRHVLLVAGPRSGKGRSLIVNNLATWLGSIISIDPKAENAMLTAARRGKGSKHCEGLGQEVYVLDPFSAADPARVGPELRCYFNPLNELDPNDPEMPRKVARIAEAMLINMNKNDSSWEKKGGSMIETLIMHVRTSSDFKPEDRTLIKVRRLLLAGDQDGYNELKSLGVKDIADPQALLWQGVIENRACNGMISDMGRSFLSSFKNNIKYYDSVKTSAEEQTKWIDSAGMRAILGGPGHCSRTFRLDQLKNDPKGISVFMCLPQGDLETYARWQRMMVELMISTMQATQTRPACGHRVLFSLDEFAGLGRMEKIRSAAAEIAGAGVKLFLTVQTLVQLKAVYDEGWETFVGNSGLQIYFGMDDNFTREYIQKSLGETEIIRTVRNTNESVNEQKQTGRSTSQGGARQTGKSVGGQEGWNKGTSGGSNSGWSTGSSGGSQRNWGRGWGDSSGRGYGPHILWENWEHSTNYNRQSGGNRGGGSNSGWSTGTSGGSNSGWSKGTSGGTNWSEQTSQTEQWQTGTQESESITHGRGQGTSETIQKRPLLTFDEANRLFARIDDPDHPAYPGLALVRISGRDPVLVRRVNYDEDPRFVRCFDPHPAHPFVPLKGPRVQRYDAGLAAPADFEKVCVHPLRSWSAERTVDLPVQEVYRALLHMKWTLGNSEYSPVPDPFRRGTRINGFHYSSPNPENAYVYQCDPNSTFGVIRYGRIESFDLRAISPNKTKVEYTFSYFHPETFWDTITGKEKKNVADRMEEDMDTICSRIYYSLRAAFEERGFDFTTFVRPLSTAWQIEDKSNQFERGR